MPIRGECINTEQPEAKYSVKIFKAPVHSRLFFHLIRSGNNGLDVTGWWIVGKRDLCEEADRQLVIIAIPQEAAQVVKLHHQRRLRIGANRYVGLQLLGGARVKNELQMLGV